MEKRYTLSNNNIEFNLCSNQLHSLIQRKQIKVNPDNLQFLSQN